MGPQPHIMSFMSHSLQSRLFRPLVAFFWMVILLPFGARSQGETTTSTLHAGWQAGPMALQTERAQDIGAHHLGNTGYGQAVSIQARWNGPWEIEFQGARGHVVTDDGALHGLRTEIQSAAVMVNYTLGGEETQRASTRNARMTRGFQPFVGVGIAHVDHLMKQDLEDHMGRRYHLWSDGTLRDRDESGDHDGNAPILRRDYTYESEVGDGALPSQRSLAIPAQIGIRMDVSPRVRTRFGVGGWLGLTDHVDGRSEGSSVLSGDALAAGFFGIGIRLGKLGRKLPPAPSHGMVAHDAALLAAMDTDEDGIDNLRDRCPGTPKGAMVNAHGCAIDSDGDGYADYRDAEPQSKHTWVDAHGVAIDPFAPRSADWDTIRGQIASDPADLFGYTLRIPKPETGWTEAEQHSLMAFAHLKETSEAMEIQMGDNPLAAGQAAHSLESQGLEAEIVAPDVDTAPTAATEEVDIPTPTTAHFRVQLGAFHAPEQAELDALFSGMDVVRFRGDDGLTRVVSQAFTDRSEAVRYKVTMEQRGFVGAFLTTHGPQAESTPTRAEQLETPQFDADKVRFRIQLGALKDRVATEAMDAFLAVGQVEHRAAPGWHRYLQGDYATLDAAKTALPGIQAAGFADAFVVGDVAGRVVPAAEALILIQRD